PDAVSQSLFSVRSMRRRQGVQLSALLHGHVDAICVTDQHIEMVELANATVVADVADCSERSDRINNLTPIAFTVRGDLLDERPDIVDCYLAEAIRTARWAQTHPSDAKRL